jgi:tetratricopeptide (TPR) repeat protein
MLTQALWFSIPIFTRHFQLHTGLEPIDAEFRGHYILWIVLGHGVQYLWVTAYFARSSSGWRGYTNYFAKALIAGTAAWALPVIIFAPDLIGRLPFDAGLALLVAAAVNVHHFILDGAIWKLRNSRIANVLIRSVEPSDAASDSGSRERRWVRHIVWATACVSLVISFFEFGTYHFVYSPAYERQDYEQANESLERLAWFGYDRAHSRLALGTRLAERGELEEALRLIERSIELYPTGEAYFAAGSIREHNGQLHEARDAYEAALALIPDRAELLVRAGNLLLRLGEPEQAREYLERAVALRPDDDSSRRALDRAESGANY